MSLIRNIIREVIGNIFSEGLIKTVNIEKTINLINRNYKEFLTANLQEDEKRDKVINVFLKEKNIEKFISFLDFINNLGYFISTFSLNNSDVFNKFSVNEFTKILKNDNIKNIKLILEAKFDILNNELPNIVYHITNVNHLEKIKKYGLVPKTQSKKSYHPERIYLAKTIDDAINFATQIDGNYENWDSLFLLYIDTNKIKNEKFYKDPNFKDKGIYILNNIHKEAIIKIENLTDYLND